MVRQIIDALVTCVNLDIGNTGTKLRIAGFMSIYLEFPSIQNYPEYIAMDKVVNLSCWDISNDTTEIPDEVKEQDLSIPLPAPALLLWFSSNLKTRRGQIK